MARGVVLRERTPVASLRPVGERAEVMTAGGETIRVAVAVVTAGAWAKGLVAGAGIDLPVTSSRETVAFFRIERETGLPTFVDWGDPLTYSLPSPGQGVKVGMHRTGPATDPDRPSAVDERAVSRMAAWVARYYPAADRQAHHAETCLYTSTEDEDFILERHGPIVVGSPCSGHGFKFAPLIGERLAQLAVGTV